MDKVCWEFKKGEDIQVRCLETDDGYRIEVKGDKEALKKWKRMCCVPTGDSCCGTICC